MHRRYKRSTCTTRSRSSSASLPPRGVVPPPPLGALSGGVLLGVKLIFARMYAVASLPPPSRGVLGVPGPPIPSQI
eukprot:782218-Prorocentrum_minimum.AAC.1